MSDPAPTACPRCAGQIPAGAAVCPGCGGSPPSGPLRGFGLLTSSVLMLWPVPLVIFAVWLDEGFPIILAVAFLVLNGPISAVIVRNSHVPPSQRTWRVLGDLRRASPAASALAFVLLGLTWFLPLLALGGCVCILVLSSWR